MLVLSENTAPGTQDATPFNHYSLLRTNEEILGGAADRRGGVGNIDARSLRPVKGVGARRIAIHRAPRPSPRTTPRRPRVQNRNRLVNRKLNFGLDERPFR
jgi:hypothetical protein